MEAVDNIAHAPFARNKSFLDIEGISKTAQRFQSTNGENAERPQTHNTIQSTERLAEIDGPVTIHLASMDNVAWN